MIMQASNHAPTNSVAEGLNVGGDYHRVENGQGTKKRSIPRLAWNVTVGALAVAGAALGGTALGLSLRKEGSPAVSEPYGLSGLVPNGTAFTRNDEIPIMPNPYLYGFHRGGNGSFTGLLPPGNTATCQLNVMGQSETFNANQKAHIEVQAENPTDYAAQAFTSGVSCTNVRGSQSSTPMLTAIFHDKNGRQASQTTTLVYQP